MKTLFEKTRTGTNVVVLLNDNDKIYKRVLFKENGDIILITTDYEGTQPSDEIELRGDILQYVKDLSSWVKSEMYDKLKYAIYLQQKSHEFYYNNTISDIIRTKLTPSVPYYLYLLLESEDKNKQLQESLKYCQESLKYQKQYGTTDRKAIAKIQAKEAKEAAKKAKIQAKIDEKIKKENLKLTIKFCKKYSGQYLYEERIYTGSVRHLKFKGVSIGISAAKTRHKVCEQIDVKYASYLSSKFISFIKNNI